MIRGAFVSAGELARTYGARGVARRALHEILIKTGAYTRSRAPSHSTLGWRRLPLETAAMHRWYAAHPDATRALIAEADALLAGRSRFFGGVELEVGWPPAWHRHPRTGVAWSSELHWTQARDSSPERGDIKWIWEPSRFGFAWLLARAFVASGDSRFAHELWRGIRSWASANPPYRGAGWSCGQETAMRTIALVFAASAIRGSSDDARLVDDLLHASGRRIALTLGHALSQRNNHAMSEAVGLWTLAALCEKPDAEVARWRTQGEQGIVEAVHDQFAEDGAYIQDSLNYHRLAVELLLWTSWVARVTGAAQPVGVRSALTRSRELLEGLLPASGGALPNYGHNDGALLLPLSSCDRADMRPTLQLLARELTESSAFPDGAWDELALWAGRESSTALAQPAHEPFRATSSGYVTARAERWLAFTRVPCVRDHRPAQADALHLDVWCGARNVALDPGTFAYSEPPPWDNRLAETRVHDTCSIGDDSQMRRRGRFLWTHWTCAVLIQHAVTPERVAMLVRVRPAWNRAHVHWRIVSVDRDGVDVLDAIAGPTVERLRLHWNLDGTAWVRDGATWRDGDLAVSVAAPPDAQISDVRGDPDSERGWSSRTYGTRVPCVAIEAEVEARETWFHTRFGTASALDPLVLLAWQRGEYLPALHRIAGR